MVTLFLSVSYLDKEEEQGGETVTTEETQVDLESCPWFTPGAPKGWGEGKESQTVDPPSVLDVWKRLCGKLLSLNPLYTIYV